MSEALASRARRAPRRAPERTSRARAFLVGASLIVAFSPLLVDWFRHLAAEPWARYAALFPLLFVRAARREPVQPASGLVGPGLLLALAVGIELVAVGGGEMRLGRIALPLAAIGFCRLLGFGSWRSQALWLLSVPIPSLLLGAASPQLEEGLLRLASNLSGHGVPTGTDAGAATGPLAIGPSDGGLALMPLLAGISWYGSVLAERRVSIALVRAAASTLLALPVQVFALCLALGLSPQAGRSLLEHGPWLLVAVVGLMFVEQRARLARSRRSSA